MEALFISLSIVMLFIQALSLFRHLIPRPLLLEEKGPGDEVSENSAAKNPKSRIACIMFVNNSS